jgi:hypothetical protein
VRRLLFAALGAALLAGCGTTLRVEGWQRFDVYMQDTDTGWALLGTAQEPRDPLHYYVFEYRLQGDQQKYGPRARIGIAMSGSVQVTDLDTSHDVTLHVPLQSVPFVAFDRVVPPITRRD